LKHLSSTAVEFANAGLLSAKNAAIVNGILTFFFQSMPGVMIEKSRLQLIAAVFILR
jgi:hypothetical protein